MKKTIDDLMNKRVTAAEKKLEIDPLYLEYNKKGEDALEKIKNVLPDDKKELIIKLENYLEYKYSRTEVLIYKEAFQDGFEFHKNLDTV